MGDPVSPDQDTTHNKRMEAELGNSSAASPKESKTVATMDDNKEQNADLEAGKPQHSADVPVNQETAAPDPKLVRLPFIDWIQAEMELLADLHSR